MSYPVFFGMEKHPGEASVGGDSGARPEGILQGNEQRDGFESRHAPRTFCQVCFLRTEFNIIPARLHCFGWNEPVMMRRGAKHVYRTLPVLNESHVAGTNSCNRCF